MYHHAPMHREPPYRQPLLFQPYERQTTFAFSRIVDEVRAVWFPELDVEIEARIDAVGPLASVWYHRMGHDRHVVIFHPVLNRPDVPEEVVRFIAKHEVAHISVLRPGHPPEFWAKESEVAPERVAAWRWIFANFGQAFASNGYGIWLRNDWGRRLKRELGPYMPHLPLEDPPFSVLCPEGGAQLRFEPTWSAAPAPFLAG